MDSETPRKTVQLNEQTITDTLDQLDDEQIHVLRENRQHPRYPYRNHEEVVRIMLPSKTACTGFFAPTRNINQSGITFLHGEFVHVNTDCHIQLQRLDGGREDITGIVVRCTHIKCDLHEIDVKFAREINLLDFFDFS